MEIYKAELVKLDNQVRFILGVVEGEIVVCKRKKAELVNELRERGFIPIHKKKPVESPEDSEETENTEDHAENLASTETHLSDFDYLLSMTIGNLTHEKVKDLCANKDRVIKQIEQLTNETERSLWLKDLDALEKALDVSVKRLKLVVFFALLLFSLQL